MPITGLDNDNNNKIYISYNRGIGDVSEIIMIMITLMMVILIECG